MQLIAYVKSLGGPGADTAAAPAAASGAPEAK